jgi:hypothetical protein
VVVGRDGKPVAGIHVKTMQQEAVTDADGKFTVKDVPAGITTVSAWNWDDAKGMKPEDGKRLVGVVPQVVDVKGNEETKVGTIQLGPTVSASGRAVGEDGKPLPGITVRVRMDIKWIREAKWVGAETTTNEKGEFVLAGVPIGAGVEINAVTRITGGSVTMVNPGVEKEGQEIKVGDIKVTPAPAGRLGRG